MFLSLKHNFWWFGVQATIIQGVLQRFETRHPVHQRGKFCDFHRILLSLEFPASCHNIAVIIKCFAGPPLLPRFCVKTSIYIDLHRFFQC